MPIAVTLVFDAHYKTQQYDNAERNDNLAERFEYTSQLLVSRKFGSGFSAQIMPTFVHRNLVENSLEQNDITALGFGASYKLYKRFCLNAEYFMVQNHGFKGQQFFDPVSIGICYQTSRHAFELFATNSQGISDNNYIANTSNDFMKGEIRIGFNISTIFTLKKSK